MKPKRVRAVAREGPPCIDCGRPTPPRSNWSRLLWWGRAGPHQHRCRRCYRRWRANDRRGRRKPPVSSREAGHSAPVWPQDGPMFSEPVERPVLRAIRTD